jgi:hypothetical protein
MAEDFFGSLGKSLKKGTDTVADRTSSFFEIQKKNARVVMEQREIDKLLADIGKSVRREYEDGRKDFSPEVLNLLSEIDTHKDAISELKTSINSMKGQKQCPKCGAVVDKSASFCPKCGEPIPEIKEEEPAQEAPAEEPAPEEAAAEEPAAEEPAPEDAPAGEEAPETAPEEAPSSCCCEDAGKEE